MKSAAALAGALSSLVAVSSAAPAARAAATSSLYVDEAPQHLRAYVLPNMAGQAVAVGQQIYRFSVTGNASAGAFTLMQTNAPDSTALGVQPHIHKEHYENFYCTKGRVQLWAAPGSANDTTSQQEARVLTQGDYGAVPHNTIHTFQILDPDTQLTGVIQPGGFEELFIAIGDGAYTSVTGAPFVPAASNSSSSSAGSSPAAISALESFDVYAQLDFSPRRDLVNGSATATGSSWHDGANALAADAATPAFVAKNYGPKYLNVDDGAYRIVQPLVTATQSAGNFSMGTITMSPLLANQTTPPAQNLTQHLAFQVEEGQLVVALEGETASLIQGDVVFIPAGTPFTYHASRPFTKFLYVSAGADGLDHQLLQKSVAWDYASYPTYAGYTI